MQGRKYQQSCEMRRLLLPGAQNQGAREDRSHNIPCVLVEEHSTDK
jgi:hypothetical protein